jgi:hypothetical protein
MMTQLNSEREDSQVLKPCDFFDLFGGTSMRTWLSSLSELSCVIISFNISRLDNPLTPPPSRDMMTQLNSEREDSQVLKPCDFFDLFGGTSTGGCVSKQVEEITRLEDLAVLPL